MPKTEQLQIRVSAKQKSLIKARAARAGEDVSKWVLRQLLTPTEEQFQTLGKALASKRRDRAHVLAEVHDFLAGLNARALTQAVRYPPGVHLTSFEANYLAAMVEYACAAKVVEAPEWTKDVEPLETPWFASTLENLRLYLLTHSPPPFRRRNLFVDSSIGDRV